MYILIQFTRVDLNSNKASNKLTTPYKKHHLLFESQKINDTLTFSTHFFYQKISFWSMILNIKKENHERHMILIIFDTFFSHSPYILDF